MNIVRKRRRLGLWPINARSKGCRYPIAVALRKARREFPLSDRDHLIGFVSMTRCTTVSNECAFLTKIPILTIAGTGTSAKPFH